MPANRLKGLTSEGVNQKGAACSHPPPTSGIFSFQTNAILASRPCKTKLILEVALLKYRCLAFAEGKAAERRCSSLRFSPFCHKGKGRAERRNSSIEWSYHLTAISRKYEYIIFCAASGPSWLRGSLRKKPRTMTRMSLSPSSLTTTADSLIAQLHCFSPFFFVNT